MAVSLEGGCRVSQMDEGAPQVVGTLAIWSRVGKATGATAISMRILEFGPGLSPGLSNPDCDEVFYLLEDLDGEVDSRGCTIFIDGLAYELETQTGIYLRPGQTLTVDNPGPHLVRFVSSQCPEAD